MWAGDNCHQGPRLANECHPGLFLGGVSFSPLQKGTWHQHFSFASEKERGSQLRLEPQVHLPPCKPLETWRPGDWGRRAGGADPSPVRTMRGDADHLPAWREVSSGLPGHHPVSPAVESQAQPTRSARMGPARCCGALKPISGCRGVGRPRTRPLQPRVRPSDLLQLRTFLSSRLSLKSL